jgi:flagellin
MALVVNTNMQSLNAQRNLSTSQTALSQSLQRLSSGLRINSAKDDAAGLAISSRMTTQINGLNQAARNANDGISLSQTAEGALVEVTNNLQRIRELAVQSANATNTSSDRDALNSEVQQRIAEIDRIATQTQFNGLNLLDGSFTSQVFQVGANQGQTITVNSITSARTSSLGQGWGADVTGTTLTGNTGITGAGQFKINNVDVYQGATISGDAKSLAAAINSANIAGVTATARATTAAGAYTGTAGITAGTATLTINNIDITLNLTANGATDVANTIAAIQSNSAATGVTAADNGGAITLTAADGRNIDVGFALGTATNAALQDIGLGTVSATTYGTYDLSYSGTDGVTVGGTAAAGVKGLADGTTNAQQNGTAVSAIDISSLDGANQAIVSMDNALLTISSSRASLGALQNRFESTIANIQTNVENLTASRSRITDADFAAETASLSRNQILQQAGTAMLAQANQLPQNVLSLLR